MSRYLAALKHQGGLQICNVRDQVVKALVCFLRLLLLPSSVQLQPVYQPLNSVSAQKEVVPQEYAIDIGSHHWQYIYAQCRWTMETS